MEAILLANLEQLEAHLIEIKDDLATPLNAMLIDDVELLITEGNTTLVIPKLLPLLTQILPSYPQDPTLLAGLSAKLLRPLPFPEILRLAPEKDIVLALQSPFPSVTLLGISILTKASATPSYVAILSNMKAVISGLVRAWLCTPDTGVAEAATKLIGDLLETDCSRTKTSREEIPESRNQENSARTLHGQGLLWRRIFQDQDIYNLIFSLCSLKTTGSDEKLLDQRQKTLAQARLLRLLPRLSVLDYEYINHSHFPEIELKYGVQSFGLLHYAAVEMVDKEDLLMHITLVNFFGDLLNFLSKVPLSSANLASLGELLKKATSESLPLRESFKMTLSYPESTSEIRELLTQLKEFYDA